MRQVTFGHPCRKDARCFIDTNYCYSLGDKAAHRSREPYLQFIEKAINGSLILNVVWANTLKRVLNSCFAVMQVNANTHAASENPKYIEEWTTLNVPR